MAATAVTLNDLKGHSQVASLFKCNPTNICAAFYTISTDNVLAVQRWNRVKLSDPVPDPTRMRNIYTMKQ